MRILQADGSSAEYVQCLVTVGPGLFARLAPDLPAGYLQGLLNLKQMGAVVMMALKHPLSPDGKLLVKPAQERWYPYLRW